MYLQAADCEGAAASSDMPQTAQNIPTFDTVQLDAWTAAALNKKDKYGMPIVLLNGPVQGKPPVVDLFRKTDAWAEIPMKMLNEWDRPAFLTGPAAKPLEGLPLHINIGDEQIAFIERMEAWIKAASQAWLGNRTDDEIEAMFCSCLRRNDKYPTTLKGTVVLATTGCTNVLTQIKYAKDGAIHKGSGWDFLKPFISPHMLKGCEARIRHRPRDAL